MKMQHAVYYPQAIEGGRFIVSELRSFLWFKWWRPIPDLYVEFDRLLLEEKNLKLRAKQLASAMKKEKDDISKFIEYSLSSYQGYSRSLSPRKRKLKRVDTSVYGFQDLSLLEGSDDKKDRPRERGPPTASVHYASDNAPSSSSNQKGGGNNQKGNNKQ